VPRSRTRITEWTVIVRHRSIRTDDARPAYGRRAGKATGVARRIGVCSFGQAPIHG